MAEPPCFATLLLMPLVLQDLWMMELFCGAGGLSFLAQSDDKTKISIGWANDLNPSAATAYTTNHPNAMVRVCMNPTVTSFICYMTLSHLILTVGQALSCSCSAQQHPTWASDGAPLCASQQDMLAVCLQNGSW